MRVVVTGGTIWKALDLNFIGSINELLTECFNCLNSLQL